MEEALAAGIRIRAAVTSPALEATTRGKSLQATLAERAATLAVLEERELEELADTEHPQGVIAVIEPRSWRLEDIPATPQSVVLALDGVQDPGNVGTIARTAFALGAAGLVALKGTAELTNPKVLRGSMGALFRLPSVSASDDEFLAWTEKVGAEIWVTDITADPPIRPSVRPPVALLLGNEGAGVREFLASKAKRRVGIPMAQGAESLNVAVATGILLYEVLRER